MSITTFKKQFPIEDFLKAISSDWQKTREIADKVGCKNKLVTDTLLGMIKIVPVGYLLLPVDRTTVYRVFNEVGDVTWRWTKGGKQGTREWRLKEIE